MIGEKSERKSKVCILQMGYGFPHGTARSSDFLYNAPEFRGDSLPEYQVIEYNPSEKSSFMAHRDWIEIATIIETLYPEVDGFVILMGTDTMAYCASALSFMLQNLAKPVVVTGGAVPLCEVYNDSRRNLIVSMLFACSTQLCEVCIFFNDVLLRGNRTRKISSQGMDAFCSPNFPPLGRLRGCVDSSQMLSKSILLPIPLAPLFVCKDMGAHIFVLKVVPGMHVCRVVSEILQDPALQALIMEDFSLFDSELCKELTSCVGEHCVLQERDFVIATVTQVPEARRRQSASIQHNRTRKLCTVQLGDMTIEAAVTKMLYLLSLRLESWKVCQLLSQNMRGEISTVYQPLHSTMHAKL